VVKEKGNIRDLETEVIYNGLCCYCGSCGAFCKEYITYENGIPVTKKKCDEIYGACYDFCPRTFFSPFKVERLVFGDVRTDNLLGYYKGEEDIVTARATEEAIRVKAQDGGVVSALLIFLLEHGDINAAVVSKTSENWEPEPFVATSKDDILTAAGSKYTQCPSVLGVGDAFEQGYENVALVGLPCHIQGMRKVQLSKGFDVGADRVKFLIGLFCSETFDMELFTRKVEELGTSIGEVKKFNIKKGKFIIYTRDGKELKTPIKSMRGCVREACAYCYDFAAEFADLSVGSIGSELGWSTVISRSEAGRDLIKRAEEKGVIETKKLSEAQIKEVRNLSSFKKRENLRYMLDKTELVRILNLLVEPEMLERFLCTE
jgi:coenzyme F420 hydrogenase subunit beta